MKKTKIVSTLGPASTDVETITKLIELALMYSDLTFHMVTTLNILIV